MESILLILSGAILAAGVLYWFWSHIQLTQKKVQLLENAVFELRGMLTNGSTSTGEQKEADPQYGETQYGDSSQPQYGGEPQYNDLPDDDWEAPVVRSTSLEELQGSDDLQPGGHAGAPSLEVKEIQSESEFRELFVQPPQKTAELKTPEVKEVGSESLEGMPVKELRRLAEQRGLTGVSELKKKELISALRQQIGSYTEAEQGTTMDLTETDLNDATLLEENL
jgi:hypothetical protein